MADAERLLASDQLTPPTRAALRARLGRRFGAPGLFDEQQMRTLRAASARLIPAPDLAEAVDLAGAFDALLMEGDGDGWRYADLPPDRELHLHGLDALNAAALLGHGRAFEALGGEVQDQLLNRAAAGELIGVDGLDSARWFEELLASLVGLHFANPLVQIAMGYDGMADAHGWQAVSLSDVAMDAKPGAAHG